MRSNLGKRTYKKSYTAVIVPKILKSDAPVTAGKLPLKPFTKRIANQANAVASTQVGESPKTSVV